MGEFERSRRESSGWRIWEAILLVVNITIALIAIAQGAFGTATFFGFLIVCGVIYFIVDNRRKSQTEDD